jgi:hypothetical protein
LGTRREHIGNKGKNEKKIKFRILKHSKERKFVVYVEACTHEFGLLEIGRDIMATPQGWEEIMPNCRCKNPPIHKPHDVHRGLFFFFFFFNICNVAELAFIPNTV